MEEQQKEEWKKLLGPAIKKVEIETFEKQFFMVHPNKPSEFIDYKDDGFARGMTMLICAIWYERWDIARLLVVEHGADINIADEWGRTALMWASTRGHNDMVKLLLEHGADVKSADKWGHTALICASSNGHNGAVKLLLEKGADISVADKNGETALMLASRAGYAETVKLLLDMGADITVADNKGKTALMWASREGHNDIVQRLLDKGADITVTDEDGKTALTLATEKGHTEIVKLLLDKGADFTIADKDGKNALTLATEKGHAEIVLLLQLAANPNIASVCNSNGQTFLHQACLQNMQTLAQHALDVGTDKDKLEDKDHHTALFYAAEKGFAGIVDVLMMHNADADKTDERRLIEKTDKHGIYTKWGETYSFYSVKDGRTPLFVAAQNGHQNIVASLLRHGANPYLCNHEGRLPRHVSENHDAIQQLFRIHDFFEEREKGDAYKPRYKTCKEDYVGSSEYKGKVPPLEDIIHDIVKYPHYADKFLELYQENREIVNWRDKDDRTVEQVACKQCREAILFMGRFYLDDQPVYESPTCKIYNALDYGGPEEDLKQPRSVAMKFIRELEHFLNEMRSRRSEEDGSPRFSSDFVTPDFASYRADEDPKYAEGLKIWKRVKNGTETGADAEVLSDHAHCVVMPQGQRSLLESMNAENLSAKHKDLQRREILLTLCKIFSYIHGMGYVHGDIKPHNVVRHLDGGNVTWKAIDFDACTKIGDVVGLKLTTGSAPPEMVKIVRSQDASDAESMVESKVIFRQPGGSLDESDLVKADPSFDVWSFGILVYQLVTGGSFFHCDLQGNLVEAGLPELANLTEGRINEKLATVDDVNARVLLSRIFRLDPKERPTMSEIAKDYYFSPSESPQGRKAQFFGKQMEEKPSCALETNQVSGVASGDDEGSGNMEDLESFLSCKSEFSYFKLRDEDKDWSDKLLNSEVETFNFDELGGMGEKPKFIDGDTIYNNSFLRGLLSSKGPDFFMGLLVEYFELYKIMQDAHEVCQGIKANLVSDVKDLKGIFIKLFVRGKGLNDIVRGTLFCNSVNQFEYVGRQLKERYGHKVYIKPPKKEAGAWPIPKLLIYGNRRFHGRCMSVEIQFSTVYMHLATHASNNHLVYEAIRESTGYLGDKDEDFQMFLQSLNQQYIDTEGFLQNQSALEGRFEILVEKEDEGGSDETHRHVESDKKYIGSSTGFITSGRIRCGSQLIFRFMSPTDRFQRFSESSYVVNRNLTLLSSHSYWSDESYDLEGKSVEFVVSFKGRGMAIAGIGTAKCFHGSIESNGGGERCSVHVGRSKFVVRKNGVEKFFQEKKLPNQERAKIIFKMQDGTLSVSFVGSSEETTEYQVSMPSDQRYYLYMRAPPGVHDIKFHDININPPGGPAGRPLQAAKPLTPYRKKLFENLNPCMFIVCLVGIGSWLGWSYY